jgi:hypothetical protein
MPDANFVMLTPGNKPFAKGLISDTLVNYCERFLAYEVAVSETF